MMRCIEQPQAESPDEGQLNDIALRLSSLPNTFKYKKKSESKVTVPQVKSSVERPSD